MKENLIDSDASLIGWGATCQNQQTGGPWSQSECSMHINCLELLATTLAVHTFLKNKTKMSTELVGLAKNLWMWCLERNIHITAQHLPGVQNCIADAESRIMRDRSDWQLNPVLFNRIMNLFGPVGVDMFASRLTTQCPVYFSWRPDPMRRQHVPFYRTGLRYKGMPTHLGV